MTFRPGPLRAAAALAAGFVVVRVVYRVLFHGADGDGPVLIALPEIRLPAPFAHVVMFGPVTADGLRDAAAGALPIALTILAFGALNAVVDLHRVFARASRRGPLRGVARALAIAWATLPSLAEGARAVRFAQRLRGERGGARTLLPLLQRTLERAGAVAAALELRGFAGRGLGGDCLTPVEAHGVELGFGGHPDASPAADPRLSRGAHPTLRLPTSLRLATGTLTLVSGPTGSGKTTLLRALAGLHSHADGGWITGSLHVVGHDRGAVPPRDLAQRVGVVLQHPREAFTAERVRDEVGLALELRGVAPVIVAARVADVAERVGVSELLDRPTRGLSAGEATLVAIAAAIVEHPILLLVDEPLADLDAAARARIAGVLDGLAHEAGVCVVVAEHRVGALAAIADTVLGIEGGEIREGSPVASGDVAEPSVGAPARVRRGRAWEGEPSQEIVLRAREITVRHGGIVAVRAADIDLRAGEIVALVGPNGAGKSSLLAALALPDRAARIETAGRMALLPDASDDLFVCDTVAAECDRADRRARQAFRRGALGTARRTAGLGTTVTHRSSDLARNADDTRPHAPGLSGSPHLRLEQSSATTFAGFLGLRPDSPEFAERRARHPRDLSAGERRCLALALQLAAAPPVLMVDEPTRGLDPDARAMVWRALTSLAAAGTGVLVASHEPELLALADRTLTMDAGVVTERAATPPGVDGRPGAPRPVASGAAEQAQDSAGSSPDPSSAAGRRATGTPRQAELWHAPAAPEASAPPAPAAAEASAPSPSPVRRDGRGAAHVGHMRAGHPAKDTPRRGHPRAGHRAKGTARATRPRSAALAALATANLVALGAFCWPLVATAVPEQAHAAVPVAALALIPLAALVVVATLDGTVRSAHLLALLGTLAAIGAAVRIASTGVGGVEAVFILLILAGRAFGARFGMLLGMATIALSTLVTGTFGPWTPFQMFACAWVGAGAGLLPRLSGAREITMLSVYGVVASYLFGLLMNLWFWPFAVGYGTGISYDGTAPLEVNLSSFLLYSLLTSTLSWDTLRAITTVAGLIVVGRPVLAALRRTKPLQVPVASVRPVLAPAR